MKKRNCPFQSGQALLEIVVALVVAGLVILALAKATAMSLKSANFAKNESLATQYARTSLEETRILKETDPATFFAPDSCDASSNTGIFTIDRDCSLVDSDTMTVVATVSWVEGTETHQSRLETKLTRR